MSDDRSNESNSLELPSWAVIDIHQENHSSQRHAAAFLHSITEALWRAVEQIPVRGQSWIPSGFGGRSKRGASGTLRALPLLVGAQGGHSHRTSSAVGAEPPAPDSEPIIGTIPAKRQNAETGA
jgi:hypothetical protein